MTSSEVTKVDTSGNGVKATVKTPDGETTLEADILLSAVGVSANIEGIGLEELGIKTDKGKYWLINLPNKCTWHLCHWRLCAWPGFGTRCFKEGIICVENIAFNEKKFNHKPKPWIMIMFRVVLIALLKLLLLVIQKNKQKMPVMK